MVLRQHAHANVSRSFLGERKDAGGERAGIQYQRTMRFVRHLQMKYTKPGTYMSKYSGVAYRSVPPCSGLDLRLAFCERDRSNAGLGGMLRATPRQRMRIWQF
jgi:hypothetical protein